MCDSENQLVWLSRKWNQITYSIENSMYPIPCLTLILLATLSFQWICQMKLISTVSSRFILTKRALEMIARHIVVNHLFRGSCQPYQLILYLAVWLVSGLDTQQSVLRVCLKCTRRNVTRSVLVLRFSCAFPCILPLSLTVSLFKPGTVNVTNRLNTADAHTEESDLFWPCAQARKQHRGK
jgi:hypothetical protein